MIITFPCPHCGEKDTLTEPRPFSYFFCIACGQDSFVQLDHRNRRLAYDGICEPCHWGYHEHHRQHIYVHSLEEANWGEPDCKNVIDGGQCMCFQQAHGDARTGKYHPFVTEDPNLSRVWGGDNSGITCVGCKQMLIQSANDAGRGVHACTECGQHWEATNRASWAVPWTKGEAES